MESPKLYLQLYSLRHETAADPEAVLRQVPSLGYQGVELAGTFGWPVEKWRSLLAETGLEAICAHAGLESLEADLLAKVEFHRALGMKRLAVPSLAKDLQNAPGYRDAAKRLTAVGLKLADADIELSYHNHAFEFEKLADSAACGLEILLAESNPAALHFEVDTFWVEHGGRDAIEFIREHASRVALIHAKDLRKSDRADVPAGQGDVDFKTLIPLCKAHGWPVILEYESAPAIEGVRDGATYLRGLLG